MLHTSTDTDTDTTATTRTNVTALERRLRDRGITSSRVSNNVARGRTASIVQEVLVKYLLSANGVGGCSGGTRGQFVHVGRSRCRHKEHLRL